ncbi:MAG TPA: 7-cyano-7-deazaguanine synthase [Allosphingosinicella sp.]|jgi:7-cyano-7-deazaguanine synthase in queuosine biosynthesis|nr:7-cyano-7-deazaguanine synthase [Allosphingosinicella sp.]
MKSHLATEQDRVLVDAVEADGPLRPNARRATIGDNLKFSTKGLEAYFFAEWQPLLVDLLVVAASADFCDLTVRRPKRGWGRAFDVRVAVHEPKKWSEDGVRSALEDALSFLTGDSWLFSFVKRRCPEREVSRETLNLGTSTRLIVPYSDGLDSRAVAALTADKEDGLVRVRLGTKGADTQQKSRRWIAFAKVPYDVNLRKRERIESSARTRGFKFAVITGIAARLADVDRILVTESGQGALGPVVAVSGHAYPDYRVHPAFSIRVERLFEALLGSSPRYEYPRIWSTKGETLKDATKLAQPPAWDDTRSCWQQARQIGFDGRLRQCGICAACMLRRMSMHTAAIQERDDEYVWESLSASDFRAGAAKGFTRFTKSLERYAIAGILHLDHLAALANSDLHRRYLRRAARQVGDPLDLPVDHAEELLLGLLNRHAREWRSFVRSLGPNSFVSQIAAAAP